MNGMGEFARENGWSQLVPRLAAGGLHRGRDFFFSRKLNAPGFRVGRSPRLLGFSHMRMGRDFHAGDHLWLEAVVEYAGQRFSPELLLGDDISVSDFVHIACTHSVRIGSGLLAGCHVLISDHAHGTYRGASQSDPASVPAQRPLSSTGPVTIGKNVWLGDGVSVLAGAHIGDGAIIGANSVVTGIIPAATIAAGAPARLLRQWDAAQREWLPIPPSASSSAL